MQAAKNAKQDKEGAMEIDRLAGSIQSDIIRNIEKQMVYVSRFPQDGKLVCYRRAGVTPEIFAKAFEVSVGMQKTIRLAPTHLTFPVAWSVPILMPSRLAMKCWLMPASFFSRTSGSVTSGGMLSLSSVDA